ncbi:MAG: translation initiation factor IF-3 [Clostridia bacterium]|nr:translation initiation factor IF-3 [Clostridia bacterium]
MKNNNNSKELLINEKINFDGSKEVRIIGADNEQLGLVSFDRALDMADDAGLDLVLIAAQAEPPVCRIMDYGKYRYERDKREKDAKKKQQVVEIKEIQLSVRIDTNDFNTKVNRARNFLTRGDKVKVVVRFKGRQMTHQEIGQELLSKFSAACEDICVIDKQPKLEGRFLSMFLAPQPTKPNKQ